MFIRVNSWLIFLSRSSLPREMCLPCGMCRILSHRGRLLSLWGSLLSGVHFFSTAQLFYSLDPSARPPSLTSFPFSLFPHPTTAADLLYPIYPYSCIAYSISYRLSAPRCTLSAARCTFSPRPTPPNPSFLHVSPHSP